MNFIMVSYALVQKAGMSVVKIPNNFWKSYEFTIKVLKQQKFGKIGSACQSQTHLLSKPRQNLLL